ncbi:2-amino-3,7-dideoxy-D-threo-hept-6-ulosonate synthase [Pseudomonas chlororaphis subsp. aureofaciens]|uniref:class I fructose-bisphosphate aldolase n=1 Tax=Pseudomonas chlororaphis TaxID=587753 RepID=UPI000F57C8EC|nr:aldolase [Pseudomonas chlororaphis]AZD84287.1 2-amino-3,7-dideoxy-D-threo-hept-6-ulosonate synthase [Pseudomonas chlororaphis subsp. aureofaciens]
MGYVGKSLRLKRLFYSGRNVGVIVPIDHGLTAGPLPGLRTMPEIMKWIGCEAISAIIVHKGILERLAAAGYPAATTGVILHLNGMPLLGSEADTKQLVTNIQTAMRMGADAVSVQVNFTEDNYEHNLRLLGEVTDAANAAGLPVLTMLYDKGAQTGDAEAVDRLHKLIRVVTEIGSDLVKIGYPKSSLALSEIVATHGANIRILVAGGEQTSDDEFCEFTKTVMNSGAQGLCAGRNVFQSPSPTSLLRRLEVICKAQV